MGSELLLQAVAFCSKVPLFSSLEMHELPRLAAALINQTYKAEQKVCRQGCPGGEMFIVRSGKAGVFESRPGEEPHQVGKLGPGDHFGVQALLHGSGYVGTVVAQEGFNCWVLESTEFEKLDLKKKLHYQKRQEVHEVGLENDIAEFCQVCSNVEMSGEVRKLLKTAMLSNHKLGPHLDHLKEDEALALAGSASKLPLVTKGTPLMKQGDTEGQLFYMIEDGLFDVTFDGRHLRQLGTGASFGEEALLFFETRRVTITALRDADVWVLHRQQFRKVLEERMKQQVDEYAAALDKAKDALQLPLNSKGEQVCLKQLASAMVQKAFFKDEYIMQVGKLDEHPYFFILHSGEVVVESAECEQRTARGGNSDGKVEFFGENALKAEPPTISVRVTSEKVQVLALDRPSFLHVLEPTGEEASQAHAKSSEKGEELERISMDDLAEVGVLGWGSYAKVTLVRNSNTSKMFALKALSKGRVMQRRQAQQVRTERLVLKTTNSRFVVGLISTFRTASEVKFLLEPCMGGDLYTVCERHEIFHSDRHARYYAACAVQGLAHLHERLVIYRDMKLENMLLDSGGCCKLADFGLAKFVVGTTFTLCGTPDYMAPEVCTGVGHTTACDWWSLGVIIYALMTGCLPFDAPRPQQIFLKVKRGIEVVLRITGFQGRWSDLVGELCKLDPSERLPVRRGGARAVRAHPWYARFDWDALNEGTFPPPYVPIVRSAEDLSNFDPNPEDAPPEVPYVDPGDDWDADFDEKGSISTRGSGELQK